MKRCVWCGMRTAVKAQIIPKKKNCKRRIRFLCLKCIERDNNRYYAGTLGFKTRIIYDTST